MTRGPKADAEQRDQTRAPRNRDPREAEAGPLVESCPGPARAPAAADVNDGPVTMDAVGPRGHAGLPDLGGQRPEPQASRLPRRTNRYASSDDRRARYDLRSADAEGAGRPLGECSVWARLTDSRCPLEAGGQLCTVRPDLPGLCQRPRRCMRPQIPGLSPGGLGPHRTSSGFPPAGFPPVSRLPAGFFPVACLPLVSLRPAFSGSVPSAVARCRFPFGSLRGPFPLSDLHGSAAARRFRRPWSRAAGAKVTSNAAPPRPSCDPPAPQMGGGRARWDAATESPVTSGREPRTPPPPNHPDRRVGEQLSTGLRVVDRLAAPGYRPTRQGRPVYLCIGASGVNSSASAAGSTAGMSWRPGGVA